jgi:hypothetical protein
MRASVRKRQRPAWRWYTAAFILLLFLLWALSSVVADLAAFRARAWVEAWENLAVQSARKLHVYRPEDADWEGAHRDARLAVSLAPFNADYHETLARVYLSRHLDVEDGDPALSPLLRKAEDEYKVAIRLRPNWPYGYMGLAYVYRREARFDAQYEQSLRSALQYGPWEPQILSGVVQLNLDALPRLLPSTRQLVLDTLRRGQAWTADSKGNPIPYGDQMWSVVTSRHREMVVCGWLRLDTPLLRQRCLPAKD